MIFLDLRVTQCTNKHSRFIVTDVSSTCHKRPPPDRASGEAEALSVCLLGGLPSSETAVDLPLGQ
jgi:hypothetical protein